jgi:hypothetical protein
LRKSGWRRGLHADGGGGGPTVAGTCQGYPARLVRASPFPSRPAPGTGDGYSLAISIDNSVQLRRRP